MTSPSRSTKTTRISACSRMPTRLERFAAASVASSHGSRVRPRSRPVSARSRQCRRVRQPLTRLGRRLLGEEHHPLEDEVAPSVPTCRPVSWPARRHTPRRGPAARSTPPAAAAAGAGGREEGAAGPGLAPRRRLRRDGARHEAQHAPEDGAAAATTHRKGAARPAHSERESEGRRPTPAYMPLQMRDEDSAAALAASEAEAAGAAAPVRQKRKRTKNPNRAFKRRSTHFC